jgi:hypothetical protein
MPRARVAAAVNTRVSLLPCYIRASAMLFESALVCIGFTTALLLLSSTPLLLLLLLLL